ncbi:MAG TPA: GDSL-type esterase/lipase family protein [Kiritimatiellia bacterium]|jgi:lysophospholipase L1-like esterase|nr:hypothetical protein [Kiritimatiellia bacterium]OQC60528.1 MAG: Arylesterase precursor [Verrucomicrobia bacterium ADurb.Bin018]MBP9572293.1 hypothetical protein [Kiritimatiellia bacterium]HOD99564.1 GDSL-type esterase/lipase family protein [Kiritimatiellia bacterium]HOE35944.1 GDSL-type esterase/lipase family protein [Kiritimatiellia bacterium]
MQKRRQWAWWLTIGLCGTLLLATGCESDDSHETPAQIQEEAQNTPPVTNPGGNGPSESTTGTPSTSPPSAATVRKYFPGGLHPNTEGSRIIAKTFAGAITPVSDAGGNRPNVIVCLGDSITDSGYPTYLAGMTGMTAIEEGIRGERSAGGVSRVGGVLSKYKPAYLCILYGANDVRKGLPASTVTGNLEKMVNAARANGTIPILATLTPMGGTYSEFIPEVQKTSAAIRDLAARLGVRLADLERAF